MRHLVDPELAHELIAPALSPSILPGDIPEMRRILAAQLSCSRETLCRDGAVEVREFAVEREQYGPVPLLVARAGGLSAGAPVILFIHGGGLVAGDETTGLEPILDWGIAFGAVVVSVRYRLAPEHQFPAALDDCSAALAWVASEIPRLGGDRDRILVIGASAGGGLAAATTLRARDLDGPPVLAQMLIYPMLDDRARLPSSTEFVGEAVWDGVSNRTGWDAYLGGRAGDDDIPAYAAPSRARSLRGLPPTYLDVGAIDTFRDEVLEFGARLVQAGVTTETHLWPGAFHGFDTAVPHAGVSRAATGARTNWLKMVLAPHTSVSPHANLSK